MFEIDAFSYLMGKKAGGGGGETVEQVEQTVEPDFSGGDMVVLPDAGKAFSKVTVEQPENLIPENIAEGVNIAGIVGALAAGGSDVKISFGEIDKQSTSNLKVLHGLGVTPDVVITDCTNSFAAYPKIAMSFALSEAFCKKCGMTSAYARRVLSSSSSNISTTSHSVYLDQSNPNPGYPASATDEYFYIMVNASYPVQAKTRWIAIGGLT